MNKTILIAAALAAAAVSQAQVLAQTSFETAEGYTVGDLSGQQGFIVDGDGYEVSADRAKTGSQSVKFDSEPQVGSNWAWQDLGVTPGSGGVAPVVKSSVWVFIAPPATSTNTATSSFGLDAYDFSVSRVATMRIRSDGTLATAVGTGSLTITNIGIVRDQWYLLEMDLDYTTKTASFRVDGVARGSGSFTNTTLGDVDLVANATGFDIGYYDDLQIEAVPEPATIAALGAGLVALARRRRRS